MEFFPSFMTGSSTTNQLCMSLSIAKPQQSLRFGWTASRFRSRLSILGWQVRIQSILDEIEAATGLSFPASLVVEMALQTYNRGVYEITPALIDTIETLAITQELLVPQYRNFCDAGDWMDSFFEEIFTREMEWLNHFFPEKGHYHLRHSRWHGREPIIEAVQRCVE